MSPFGIRSGKELAPGLRAISRIVAECRSAIPAEERKAARPRNPNQITLGQIMLLVATWALIAALLRRNG